MSSRQDSHQFLQANNLKEAGERMRQFTEFAKCQNPAFSGDVAQLSPEELSMVKYCLKQQLYDEFCHNESEELSTSNDLRSRINSDDESNYQDELADQVLPLKGALKIQNSTLSGDEDCSETPMLPPDRKNVRSEDDI